MRARERFSRRAFLEAAGLGAAMLPLLEDDIVRAACLPSGRKRLVTMTWGNGYQRWAQGADAAFTLPDIMKPLEPHRADLLIPDALFAKAYDEAWPSNPNKAHDSPQGQLLGKRMKSGSFTVADSPSIDYHVGTKLKQPGGASVINLGVMMKGSYRNWSWQGPDALARPDDDPYHAFDTLFGGARMAGTGSPQPDQVRAVRKIVLDYVQRDIGRFSRRLGKEDRDRVDAHLASVREIEGRLTVQVGAACTVPTLPARFDVESSDNFEKTLRVQIDIGVAALAAGVSQVLTIAASNGGGGNVEGTWLGYNTTNGTFDSGSGQINSLHAIAHQNGTPKTVVDRWFFVQVAYLLDKLKAAKEGAGSMFDNVVVLVPNNMDHGNAHRIRDLNWLIAGSGGGYFKTGRVVSANNAPTTQLLVGVCNAMGVSPDGFADPAYGGELPGLRG